MIASSRFGPAGVKGLAPLGPSGTALRDRPGPRLRWH